MALLGHLRGSTPWKRGCKFIAEPKYFFIQRKALELFFIYLVLH